VSFSPALTRHIRRPQPHPRPWASWLLHQAHERGRKSWITWPPSTLRRHSNRPFPRRHRLRVERPSPPSPSSSKPQAGDRPLQRPRPAETVPPQSTLRRHRRVHVGLRGGPSVAFDSRPAGLTTLIEGRVLSGPRGCAQPRSTGGSCRSRAGSAQPIRTGDVSPSWRPIEASDRAPQLSGTVGGSAKTSRRATRPGSVGAMLCPSRRDVGWTSRRAEAIVVRSLRERYPHEPIIPGAGTSAGASSRRRGTPEQVVFVGAPTRTMAVSTSPAPTPTDTRSRPTRCPLHTRQPASTASRSRGSSCNSWSASKKGH
jgi:hypothetical protein